MELHSIPLPVIHDQNVNNKFSRFIRKIFKFDQMDFQFALWQMVYLFIAPQKLTRIFQARKHSKSQYARDDPAFLVLFSTALLITSIGFGVILGLSFSQFLKFLLFIIFIDCLGTGVVIATILWHLCNKFLISTDSYKSLEWGFSFDIHLNALFPPLILLHLLLIIFFNDWFNQYQIISLFLGNTFWVFGAIYYVYITFLGYNSMHILKDSKIFIAPVPWIILFYILTLILKINLSQAVLNFYLYRVVII